MSKSRRHVLIVAFHYPPVAGSSGVQRTLSFTKYLREHGWEPVLLTVGPSAYEQVTSGQLKEIPEGMHVERVFALDSARHLSIFGRYPARLGMPDRWCTWWPMGVWKGLRLIRRFAPEVIMSTFPMPTAHWIALSLQRRSGLPWIADFRDNMTDPEYPPDPAIWQFNRRLEANIVHGCTRAVFTTRGAMDMYAQRYPQLPSDRWSIIENGFDEEVFARAESSAFDGTSVGAAAAAPLRIIHSGILYPAERDPRPFFAAVSGLKAAGHLSADRVRIVLRATGSDDLYRPLLTEHRIEDIVELAPSIGYHEALAEMLRADGLLLFQAAMANHQIPAKLYEYMRAGRPILAITDPEGDTAQAMRDAGTGTICRIDDASDIASALHSFVANLQAGTMTGTAREAARRHSRRARTADLAALLDQVSREPALRT